ncbi:larval cuticle protein 65Ag1-like [Drosophila tropicalis]|uniref:larval cuticle protein 65Ag1-like n=1 Tax=Drosophila tropicalis TaxID=46794 RepID=UPI0035AB6BB2
MKFVIVFVALFALAYAAPGNIDGEAQILNYKSDVGPDVWNSAYETSNGIRAFEDGQAINAGTDHESIVVKGSYSFVADDGKTYTINYIADDNGFQPQGEHIPQL